MSSNIKKVLLCAYACEPDKGSEPGVGWDTSLNLSKQDIESNYVVITRRNNQSAIEGESTPKNLSFIYYDLPTPFLWLKRKGNLVRTYYYLWMLGAVVKLRGRRNEFQIIHHITFVNDWLPSLFILLKTKNIFFVWGSIGSHNKIEAKFLNSTKEKFIERLRILLQILFRTFDPFFWMCKKKADIIIGISNEVKYKLGLNREELKKFEVIPAIAMSKKQLNFTRQEILPDKFKVISVGRLMYIKNFQLTLRSFANFINLISEEEQKNVELTIIGEGQLKQELMNTAKELGIDKYVCFKGQLAQKEVMDCFNESNVFLFPTLESAGFVVLEAMSYSLPVVAMDYGGPKQFVKENLEYQLASSNGCVEEMVIDLAQKMLVLYQNTEIRKEIGYVNHKTVVDNFTWEQKTESILKIYKSLIDNNDKN